MRSEMDDFGRLTLLVDKKKLYHSEKIPTIIKNTLLIFAFKTFKDFLKNTFFLCSNKGEFPFVVLTKCYAGASHQRRRQRGGGHRGGAPSGF